MMPRKKVHTKQSSSFGKSSQARRAHLAAMRAAKKTSGTPAQPELFVQPPETPAEPELFVQPPETPAHFWCDYKVFIKKIN